MKTPKLYQKKGKFYFTYKGKQYYAGSTLEAANKKIQEVIGPQAPTKDLVSSVVEAYLTHIAAQSPDTLLNKRLNYKLFAERFPSRSITSITTEDLESFRQELLKTREKPTINSIFARLSALFTYCVEKSILTENPVKKLTRIKTPRELEPDILTPEEVEKLFDLCDQVPRTGQRDKLLFQVVLNTGLRRIEVSDLEWTDIDLTDKMLIVRSGKGTKSRKVPINPTLLKILSAITNKKGYVLTNEVGGQLQRGSMTSICAQYAPLLKHTYKGEVRFSLHSLRATFLTNLANKSVSPYVIQKLAGHADLATTLHYCKVGDKDLKNAVGLL